MKEKIEKIIKYIIIYAVAIVALIPFLFSILLSVKSKEETSANLLGFPEAIQWENFSLAIEKANMITSTKNSIIVTIAAVLVVILISSMAAYAIARQYHKRGYRLYEMFILSAMMIPFQTLMIPLYKMYKSLSLLNTLSGAIIIIAGLNLPFAIIMYIGFVKTLPIELEEAAQIEGAGKLRIFWQIVLPLLKPVTSTLAVLNALWTWNEFNVSLLVLQKDSVKTIPIQQYVFFGQHSSDYNLAFAAAVISMIPIVIFFILAQKHIIKGLTSGAVKG